MVITPLCGRQPAPVPQIESYQVADGGIKGHITDTHRHAQAQQALHYLQLLSIISYGVASLSLMYEVSKQCTQQQYIQGNTHTRNHMVAVDVWIQKQICLTLWKTIRVSAGP